MAKDLSNTAKAAPPQALGLDMVRPESVGAAPAFNLPPSPYFLLMHSPQSWELGDVDGEPTWLPRLKQMPIAPGVNAVRPGRRGGPPDASLAIAQFQGRGFTVVPQDFDGGFVHRVRARGGWAHLLKFDVPKNVGRKTITRTDEAGYNRFRRRLVTDGIIAAPEPEILEGLIDLQSVRADRRAEHAHIPTAAKRLERDTKKLERMKAAANG